MDLKSWDFEITDELIDFVIKFHTKKSPGTYIGIYLLKYLVSNLGEVKGKLHIISETQGCFADCPSSILYRTVGNKYLRLIQTGHMAYTGYGRDDEEKALRVYVDFKKIDKEKYPYLYGFVTGTRPYDKYDRQTLNKMTVEDFMKLKFDIFSKEWVRIKNVDRKMDQSKKVICDNCGQTFSTLNMGQKTCDICLNKDLYFEKV